MPEPFKNNFDETAISTMAEHLARGNADFNVDSFISFATSGLEDLELKQRSSRLTDALELYLPKDYKTAANILTASLDTPKQPGIHGWPIMPMADYIARHGLQDVEFSLDVLKAMTSRFTSEFAIRPFILTHPKLTLKTLSHWAKDKDEHVRRLVSEGTRPRLPWGIQLKPFVKDPTAVLPLLESLKNDPSEYVRRSVANHLNDISKDHPDLVVELAKGWMVKAPKDRRRLIKHGLRTLIKAGHPGALSALGYTSPKVTVSHFEILTDTVQLGEAAHFTLNIRSTTNKDQPLIIDYAVHHVRSGGKNTKKVFKWKNVTLKGHETLNITRRHAFKKISTRRYYSGCHKIEILVNGKSLGKAAFTLLLN
ncbi:MAG: DNA alkylation repair protein [Rhodospirillaceae bacterium]|nr:MAG: DNA alkylation repair protein [Rhodospirillaceae bacterium]